MWGGAHEGPHPSLVDYGQLVSGCWERRDVFFSGEATVKVSGARVTMFLGCSCKQPKLNSVSGSYSNTKDLKVEMGFGGKKKGILSLCSCVCL